VITTILAVLAIAAVWANRQALDSNRWADTSTKLLQNDAIRTQIANYLVDQVYANVNVAGQLRSALPPRLQPLAGAAAGGLENLAQKAAFELLGRPRVQEAWRAAQKLTAQQFINIVEGKSKLVKLNGNAVFIDLRPILADVSQRLGLPASVVQSIPPNAAQLKVMTSNQISSVQNGVDLLRGLAIVLPALVVLLFALAVYLSIGRRRHTLFFVGIDLVIAGLIVIVARNVGGNQIVDSLAKTESVKPAVEATWSIGTALLSDIAQSVIIMGLAVLGAAALAGPKRPAVAIRRAIAPWLQQRRGASYGIVLAVLLLLVWWGPIPALRMPIPVLIAIGLLLLGIEALRRQTLEEFPDAQFGHAFAGLRRQADRFSSWRHRDRGAPPPPPIAGGAWPRALPGEGDRLSRLERLVALRDSGALTDAEFAAEKRSLLGGPDIGL
jgi:Short C-terminal domain